MYKKPYLEITISDLILTASLQACPVALTAAYQPFLHTISRWQWFEHSNANLINHNVAYHNTHWLALRLKRERPTTGFTLELSEVLDGWSRTDAVLTTCLSCVFNSHWFWYSYLWVSLAQCDWSEPFFPNHWLSFLNSILWYSKSLDSFLISSNRVITTHF